MLYIEKETNFFPGPPYFISWTWWRKYKVERTSPLFHPLCLNSPVLLASSKYELKNTFITQPREPVIDQQYEYKKTLFARPLAPLREELYLLNIVKDDSFYMVTFLNMSLLALDV